jgi:hypothetical protein
MLNKLGVIDKFCKKGHKYRLISYRCITCFWYKKKLWYIMRQIAKRREFLYSMWELYLEDRSDFGYQVAMDQETSNLYIEAEKLI